MAFRVLMVRCMIIHTSQITPDETQFAELSDLVGEIQDREQNDVDAFIYYHFARQ